MASTLEASYGNEGPQTTPSSSMDASSASSSSTASTSSSTGEMQTMDQDFRLALMLQQEEERAALVRMLQDSPIRVGYSILERQDDTNDGLDGYIESDNSEDGLLDEFEDDFQDDQDFSENSNFGETELSQEMASLSFSQENLVIPEETSEEFPSLGDAMYMKPSKSKGKPVPERTQHQTIFVDEFAADFSGENVPQEILDMIAESERLYGAQDEYVDEIEQPQQQRGIELVDEGIFVNPSLNHSSHDLILNHGGALGQEMFDDRTLNMVLHESFMDHAQEQERQHLPKSVSIARNQDAHLKTKAKNLKSNRALREYEEIYGGSEEWYEDEEGVEYEEDEEEEYEDDGETKLEELLREKNENNRSRTVYTIRKQGEKQEKLLVLNNNVRPESIRHFLKLASAKFNLRGKKAFIDVETENGDKLADVDDLRPGQVYVLIAPLTKKQIKKLKEQKRLQEEEEME